MVCLITARRVRFFRILCVKNWYIRKMALNLWMNSTRTKKMNCTFMLLILSAIYHTVYTWHFFSCTHTYKLQHRICMFTYNIKNRNIKGFFFVLLFVFSGRTKPRVHGSTVARFLQKTSIVDGSINFERRKTKEPWRVLIQFSNHCDEITWLILERHRLYSIFN